jgi:oligopeptide/dipeptide ABC transporter ATP-binding protein
MELLLDVRNLHTYFYTHSGTVRAVNGVSLSVGEGEILGIVGESGSGKSVTMRSVLRIVPTPPGRIVSGEIFFKGRDLLKCSPESIRKIRGKQIAMIFQDPMTSLNPVLTIGLQISEVLVEHLNMSIKQARVRAIELLDLVGIQNPARRIRDYPHQLSGGMRQRAMIAMALACEPSLLIADEPTTALDVTIQLQIVNLIKELQERLGMSVIWITHDLGVVARLVERVMVMYAGHVVENASVKDLYSTPLHPYTIGLLSSLPRIDEAGSRHLNPIQGQPPDMSINLPGCPFAPRCRIATEQCLKLNPELEEIGNHHHVACWNFVHAKRVKP